MAHRAPFRVGGVLGGQTGGRKGGWVGRAVHYKPRCGQAQFLLHVNSLSHFLAGSYASALRECFA